MDYIGDFRVNSTVQTKWNSNGSSGQSITRATNGSIRIYKGSSTTERSSSAGITDTEDHDSLTGVHHITIDLSDNTDAGFYAAGNDYSIVLATATIDGQTVNAVLKQFSIENRSALMPATADRRLVVDASGLADANMVKAGPTGSGTAITAGDITALINTVDDLLDTEVAAIKAKTDNLPADPADASDIASSFSTVNTKLDTIDDFLDTEVAAIKAKTDGLPADPADASDIAALFVTVNSKLDTIDDFMDTELAAIKAKTDNLPADPADASDIAALFVTVNSKLDTIDDLLDTEVAAILADTNELQTDWANGGRLDLLIDAILDDTGTAGVVVASGSKTGYSLSSSGIDAILVESGISASALLTNDTGTQLTSINFRQGLALVLSALAGKLSGGGSSPVVIKPVGLPAGNTRISATTPDDDGNRTALTLKVPD